jgi:hypothetical protein
MGICAYWFLWISQRPLIRKGVTLFWVLTIQSVFPEFVTCQELASLLEQQRVFQGPTVVFGVDKIANTFTFTGRADVQTALFGVGSFRYVMDTRNTAFRTTTLALRDDIFSHAEVVVPLGTTLAAIARQSWTLSQDSRSLGLASLERLNGGVGLRYGTDSLATVEWIGGVESSTQIGRRAGGVVTAMRAALGGIALDEWLMSGTAVLDLNRMDALRTNTDADVRVNIVRPLDGGSELRLSTQFLSLRRQFFTQVGLLADLSVETRAEQRLHIDAAATAVLSPRLTATLLGSLQSAGIDRQYSQGETDVPITAVNRRLSELVVDITGELRYQTSSLLLVGGGSLFRRDEQNGVQALFDISDQALAAIRSQENQRDNATVRTRAFAQARWAFSPRDTLSAEASSWLLRYDTPSAQNFDDRDELTTLVTLQYGRRLSSLLAAGVTLSGQSVHLVFLRAQRSALNNVNNVLRLAPYVRIEGSTVQMQPVCEVLANFTVYDFEEQGSSVRSFSFRQISLRDSIVVRLGGTLHLESHILLRYFERATLYWTRFAESPETANLERLTKFLIFSSPQPQLGVGVGIRLYGLEQRTLDGLPGPNTDRRFWAPEVSIRWTTLSGSDLSIGGWYEFQTIDVTQRRNLPNLLLQARVVL